MKLLNNIQKLTLVTLLVLALGACSNKDANDANATEQTAGTTQGGGEDGGTTNSTGTTTSTSGGSTDETNDSSNDNTTTSTENNETNPVDVNTTATLKSLTLTLAKTTLNKDETTDLSLQATYANSTSKTLTSNIEWIVSPSAAVQITDHTLTAKKDSNVTVQAKAGNTLSNTITLNITWVVNGHVLPPEPDKTLNDSTLLGIDVNDNGVRDDVERIIYKTYQNKHPIHIDIGMQAARGYKLVLETPERAREIHDEVNNPIDCNWYYKAYAKFLNEPLLVNANIVTKIFAIYFNTKEREDLYRKYDSLLSGGTYVLPEIEDMKSKCDFDTNVYEEK